ncbi:MAG: hypothetical protein R3E60_05685 [Alphaproteobacteria bacterium]
MRNLSGFQIWKILPNPTKTTVSSRAAVMAASGRQYDSTSASNRAGQTGTKGQAGKFALQP